MTETTASNSHGAGHDKKPSKAGFFAGIALFFRQMISELKKVVTPTRSELVNYTLGGHRLRGVDDVDHFRPGLRVRQRIDS